MNTFVSAVELIADERFQHVHVLGWSFGNDEETNMGELLQAARCYLEEDIRLWPWGDSAPNFAHGKVRNLTKAAAMIAAEIDRLNNPLRLDVKQD